jgi:hypothetical protein
VKTATKTYIRRELISPWLSSTTKRIFLGWFKEVRTTKSKCVELREEYVE